MPSSVVWRLLQRECQRLPPAPAAPQVPAPPRELPLVVRRQSGPPAYPTGHVGWALRLAGTPESAYGVGDFAIGEVSHDAPESTITPEPSEWLQVSFPPSFVYGPSSPAGDRELLRGFQRPPDAGPLRLAWDPATAPDTLAAVCQLIRRYNGPCSNPLRAAGCHAALLDVLYHLALRVAPALEADRETERHLRRRQRLGAVLAHLQDHYPEHFSLAEAARLAGMSPPVFQRVFKQVTGTTLVAHLNHLRLARAAELLRETHRTIAEIAVETGFSDQSYFDRRFKRAFGCPPRAFRGDRSPPAPSPPHFSQVNGTLSATGRPK